MNLFRNLCDKVQVKKKNKVYSAIAGLDVAPNGEHQTVHSPRKLILSPSSRVETVDCGDEAASWLSYFLRQPCRLIRQNPDFTRDMKRKPSEGTQPTKAHYLHCLTQRHRNARTWFPTSHSMLVIAADSPCCISLLDILSSAWITSVGINSLSDISEL